ncbi:MAG: class I adenylate-forming enzyme family protein [Phycisphaerales bacterium]
MSVHWPILRSLLRRASRVVAVDDRREYRGIDIVVAAMHVAAEIERRSATPHVGLLLPTSGAFPIAALASWMLGRVIVPLNYLLKREELAYVIRHCETDAVVTVGPMLEYLGYEPEGVDLIRLDQVHFRAVPDLRWPALADDDDLAMLLYTSGTTGLPKGVMLTHGNLSANIRQGIRGMRVTDRDVFLGVLPQFHSFGVTALTLTPLTVGGRVVFTARFSASRIIDLMRTHHATTFVGIPSMYNALAMAKEGGPDDLASVRLLISGGEPLPDAVFERFADKFKKTICEGYGMTEMSPSTHCCTPGTHKRHSVGPPLQGVEQRIVDPETGDDMGVNTDGELRMRGPNLMRGYFKMPDETRRAFDAQGYLRTGDIARIDDDGYLFITGRLKEMIIVGGENVFPREVEEVLAKHPAVAAAGVTGLRDPMRGEVVVAFVEAQDGQAARPDELRTWCRDRLAGYKCPREVFVVETLPRNPTGKVLRRELHTLLPEDHEARGALHS